MDQLLEARRKSWLICGLNEMLSRSFKPSRPTAYSRGIDMHSTIFPPFQFRRGEELNADQQAAFGEIVLLSTNEHFGPRCCWTGRGEKKKRKVKREGQRWRKRMVRKDGNDIRERHEQPRSWTNGVFPRMGAKRKEGASSLIAAPFWFRDRTNRCALPVTPCRTSAKVPATT